ncbi:hepatic triacylglycerol lipase [Pseudophryne corroboree]|uniref:hepatic triacylglycerol lipase n=1 Tax=Pseudophryne corroboree TaxID=495146 RepID=UPI003082088C
MLSSCDISPSSIRYIELSGITMGKIQILSWVLLIFLVTKYTVAKKQCKCHSNENNGKNTLRYNLKLNPYYAGYKEELRTAIKNLMSPNTTETKFMLYNEGRDNIFCPIVTLHPETLAKCAFNATLPLVIIVHGWSLDGTMEPWAQKMASAFKSSNKQINVIIVDWVISAHSLYPVAVQNARLIGLQIAEFLEWLESSIQFPRSNVHLIGYSLGAHVSGFAGSYINGSDKIGRITGLDPAGPLFEGMSSTDRLSPDDATLVDAIHTNTQESLGLSIGIKQQVGHYDFYPNGGNIQPGCQFQDLYTHIVEHGLSGFKQTVKCSHERSVHLFIDSILNEDMPVTAYECKDIDTFETGMCLKCLKNECVVLGYNINSNGVYPGRRLFLKTQSRMPYKIYHYQFKMHLKNNIEDKELFPQLMASLTGTKGDVGFVPLTNPDGVKESGTYSFLITTDTDIGDVMMIKLKWMGNNDIKNFWYNIQAKMPWTQLPGLLVKKIRVMAGETQERITFCSENVDDFKLLPDLEKTYVRCLSRLKRKMSKQ